MLPDLLAPDLKLLFCGTAASQRSAARGHYYAGPGNRFWSLLAETGLTSRRFTPEDDGLLPALGIGLTDLAKGVSGMDRDIPVHAYAPARLRALIAELRPKRLAFTSLTAAKIALGHRFAAGRTVHPDVANLPVWVLPSPSGAARGSFSSQPWYDLAEDYRRGT
jgi:TDG/mug DNA glycosylase family protein